MKTTLSILLFLASFSLVYGQKGFIRGKVTDGESGEGLYGATVLLKGTTTGATADFDGNFSISLDPGFYTIETSYVSYQTQVSENVEVKAGGVTTLDYVMKSDIAQLQEVVVTGTALKSEDAGVVTFQKKSANVLDGLSNQTFKKTGDRDLSVAIKRITGVAVQGGKYVYVRGLGDRYTRTILNGMTIPGLDPDRNDVQIDIFPTSILENVIVYKTASPNLPGDFTGGMVDIETKNFPEQKLTSVTIGAGYNAQMNLNNNFLSYNGGKTDWLGFDDGTRKLPFSSQTVIPDVTQNSSITEILTRSLNPTLGSNRQPSFINTQFAFNHGNQINRDKFTIGYAAALSYQHNYEHFKGVEFGEYSKGENPGEIEFFAEEIRKGDLSRETTLWSGLLTGAIKFNNHTISLSAFRTQNGITEASERINTNYDETLATLYENILTYSQRSVTTGMLSGVHQLGKVRMTWNNATTLSRTYDPDFRVTSISITDPDVPTLNRGDGAGIRRFWRDLNEFNENFKADAEIPYWNGSKLQFGVAGLYKTRDFNVNSYLIDVTSRSNVPLDPNYFLQPENIWNVSEKTGSYITGNDEPVNNYSSNSSVYAGYLMTEMKLNKLRAIYGARVEKADMYYTGQDVLNNIFDNDHTLDELNILPSVNLVYSIGNNLNLRGSYGKTVARPSFKEKSGAQIYDPITGRTFNGNLNLNQTLIDNYDLRIEKFFTAGDLASFSVFYKQFDGHIELVAFDVAPDNVKPRNAGTSQVYGMEVEIKKNLGFVAAGLSNFSIGSNFSLAKSEVDLKSVYVNDLLTTTEYDSRVANQRVGEVTKSTRPMGGQSPYLINANINYADKKGLMNVNLSYNVQGKSLSVIGVGIVPDVYSLPFHSLDFNAFRNFSDDKHRLSFRVSNLLNAERRDYYQGYSGAEGTWSIFRPGRTFSLSYTLSF